VYRFTEERSENMTEFIWTDNSTLTPEEENELFNSEDDENNE